MLVGTLSNDCTLGLKEQESADHTAAVWTLHAEATKRFEGT